MFYHRACVFCHAAKELYICVIMKTNWYRREFVLGSLFAGADPVFAAKSDPARSIIATKSESGRIADHFLPESIIA